MYVPLVAITPGITVFIVLFTFNTMGEVLRDIVDPKLVCMNRR